VNPRDRTYERFDAKRQARARKRKSRAESFAWLCAQLERTQTTLWVGLFCLVFGFVGGALYWQPNLWIVGK